ncbi:MAG: (d)CMP kinase [Verrucomicrobia bacterium]|nr:(d)CMP kinase [Verrucomicrobiota bacterium]
MSASKGAAREVIAIDGPAASGKSTVSRRVAKGLGYLYVDSGALYRGVTCAALAHGIPGTDTEGVLRCMAEREFAWEVADGAVTFTIDGVRPCAELRTEAVNQNVSPVAAACAVRVQVVEWLRGMLCFGSLVMEGRDIGTKVFPDTPYKFYLDANPEERARRRHGESQEPVSVAEVSASLQRRDTIDRRRAVDPLKVAPDAEVIDSTGMSIDDVVQHILNAIATRRAEST